MVTPDSMSGRWMYRRFGDYASMAYTNARVRENYSRRFSIRYPNEELQAARPLLTTSIYDRQKQAGAQFGAAFRA